MFAAITNYLRRTFFKPRLTVIDPDFGTLEFGERQWHSMNSSFGFMVILDAPSTGPTPRQREFFNGLRNTLPRYEQAGRDFVDKHRSGNTLVHVYSIVIPSDDELRNGRFVLEFSDDQADTIYRAEFENWVPTSYGEDD